MRLSAIVQRLKTRAQFQAVMAGMTVARTEHFVLHRCGLDEHAGTPTPRRPLWPVAQAWIGTVVPKRWARRAVTRNAIRRQVFLAAERMEASLGLAAHVVRLRTAFDVTQYPSARSKALLHAVRGELEQLLQRAATRPAS